MDAADYFNHLYDVNDRYWWIDKDRYSTDYDAYPYSLLTQMTLRALADRPPGRALDLGAGEGTDAIRLALMGYEVEAVEISDVAVRKIARFADDVGVSVKAVVADIRSYSLGGEYDVIICNGLLHYVDDDAKQKIVRSMQDATRSGGMNVISLWSTYTQIPECHDRIPAYCDSENGVITSQYATWTQDFLYFDRDKSETSHSELPAHRHSHIKMIATNLP